MAAGSSPYIFDVDLEDFQDKVIDASHQQLLLVDFWADWCTPCHGLAPHLYRVIEELQGKVQLAKVEVDEGENMKLAGRYHLRGFPTVILFSEGEETARFSGARATHWIHDWLQEALGGALSD
ncbi:MAG: thioredoxin family protein [Chromatiales bacterium]|jgi:putative thioredoxin